MLQNKHISIKVLAIVLLVLFALSNTQMICSQIYLDPKAPIDQRVNDLLSRMTLDEKIGQMVQTERTLADINTVIQENFIGSVLSGGGSVPGTTTQSWIDMYNGMQQAALSTRLQIPILYGIDAVHGNNNVYGATIFPHNIGLGCTRDTLIVKKCAQATAMEVKATGLDWTFSPCIAVPQDIRWGRTYEGFGETPELQEMMAGAAVRGYQGDSLGVSNRILACAKHFIADGGTLKGTNQGNAVISEADLRRIHLPGYIKAIEAGVGSIMVSFSSWNGELCHANSYLITDLLKQELGFDGIVISDWEGIGYISSNYKTSVKTSVNAGIDMFMEPYYPLRFINNLKILVNDGSVSISRIDDAVRRILKVKFKLKKFEQPYADNTLADSLGNTDHRTIAREAVRKSLVLLKNNGNLLPISKLSGTILVAGSKANEIGSQCGGWTITWQGSSSNTTIGTTILDAIKSVRGATNVVYSSNGSAGQGASIAVIVVGETPYAEGQGDNSNPKLGSTDLTTIANIKKLGIPYVVLLLSGRPIILDNVLTDANAFVACWWPGTEGLGVTDVLFGDYIFTGKLSQTWPATISQEPINWGDLNYAPLFPYGYGLSSDYTNTSTSAVSALLFNIYPNPANSFITIQSDYNGLIQIYNTLGKTEISKMITDNEKQINVESLTKGIHIIKLISANGQVVNTKFVKM